MRWIRFTQPDRQMDGLFRRALLLTLLGNLVLAGLKITAAKLSGSTALYTDAINSVSDVLYSILMIVGLWLAQQPPDIGHPQGHSRFEPFVALLITLSMALAGGEALRASIERGLQGGAVIPMGIAMAALLVSILIKAGMYTFVHRISQRILSPGLAAAAKDNLSDVVTSLAAMLGIAASNFIHPLFDPLAGILVAVWIFRSVFSTARENLGYLTGAGADETLRRDILVAAENVAGVEEVHHIITEYAGPRLVVEMHINVDGELSLNRAHEICDQTTAALEALPKVDRAYVHVEPVGHT